jgi:hypothetical protein
MNADTRSSTTRERRLQVMRLGRTGPHQVANEVSLDNAKSSRRKKRKEEMNTDQVCVLLPRWGWRMWGRRSDTGNIESDEAGEERRRPRDSHAPFHFRLHRPSPFPDSLVHPPSSSPSRSPRQSIALARASPLEHGENRQLACYQHKTEGLVISSEMLQ